MKIALHRRVTPSEGFSKGMKTFKVTSSGRFWNRLLQLFQWYDRAVSKVHLPLTTLYVSQRFLGFCFVLSCFNFWIFLHDVFTIPCRFRVYMYTENDKELWNMHVFTNTACLYSNKIFTEIFAKWLY